LRPETASHSEPDLAFDPSSPEFRQDPHRYYRQLRDAAPVYRNPAGGWLLSRHADCRAAIEDPRLRNVEDVRCYPDGTTTKSGAGGTDYARIRGAVARALSPAIIRTLRPRVQQLVDELLENASRRAEVDLVDALCQPMAAIVFCDLFGVPNVDRQLFRGWVDDAVRGIDVLLMDSPEVAERRARALDEFGEYFRRLIALRRREPADDLLSRLVAIEQDGDSLTEDELVSSCTILLIAGHESTANLVSGSAHALLTNQSELERARAMPELDAPAIDELMRHTSVAQLIVRAANEDLELGGQQVREGEYVVILLAAANRDPEVFAEPDLLDLTRDPNPHLSLGHGPHYCLGAALARMEATVALTTLLRRAPELALAGPPEYKPNVSMRGLARLPVRLR
jgi:cytochrome P450